MARSPNSSERNRKIGDARKGKKHSEISKLKISKTKKELMNDDTKSKISNGLKGNKNGVGNKGNSKRILCLTNGIIYDSAMQASIALNVKASNICNVCKGRYKQTGGYNFKYDE